MLEVQANPESGRWWLAASRGEAVDWDRLLGAYRSCVDWPSCTFWRPLADTYPDAKVLLSVRDPESWYESVSETIYLAISRAMASENPTVQALVEMPYELIFEGTFGGRFEDRRHAIGVFERHVEDVTKAIPAERLLVYDVKEGWEPLCRFTGRPIPDADFPHANSRDDFLSRMGRMAERAQ